MRANVILKVLLLTIPFFFAGFLLYNWANSSRTILHPKSFEIFVGPVKSLSVKETSLTVSLPRRYVSLEIEFTFSTIGEACSFDICLPYVILIDNKISCSARLAYEVVVWGPEGDRLTSAGRASVSINPIFHRVPFHIWSVEYKAIPRPYWDDRKPPYSDKILVEGIVKETVNDVAFSQNVTILRFFQMTLTEMAQLAQSYILPHYDWWPLWFHDNSTFRVQLEFEKGAQLSKETFPSPDNIAVGAKSQSALWKVSLKDLPKGKGVELRCVIMDKDKENLRVVMNGLSLFFVTSPVIMPVLSYCVRQVIEAGRAEVKASDAKKQKHKALSKTNTRT